MVDSGLSVSVPFLGLGIRPFGPKILASGKSFGMKAGVAMRISKSILLFFMSFMTELSAIIIFLSAVFMCGKEISPIFPGW